MKICVMNFSGNVGKTTVAGHLLKPRMNKNALIFSVESLNVDGTADGLDVEKIKAKKFGELIEQIMMIDDAIVDVGASNVEEFIKLMQQYSGSHEEFDYFVVPTVKEKKQQADTVNTLRALARLGIQKSKIRLIFNRVEVDDSVTDEFASLFGLAKLENAFTLKPNAVIYQNEIFDRLKSVNKSLGEITTDETDYRVKMREPGISPEEKELCIKLISLKRLGITAKCNLDDVYTATFGK